MGLTRRILTRIPIVLVLAFVVVVGAADPHGAAITGANAAVGTVVVAAEASGKAVEEFSISRMVMVVAFALPLLAVALAGVAEVWDRWAKRR